MITMIRRMLVLVALMFWQGGFTFYAAVVVPVGSSVLGSHREQGAITRHVTNYLNLAAAVALVPLAWEAAAGRRRRPRWACWLGMALTLAALAVLHFYLDELFDRDLAGSADRPAFAVGHRWYLWVSTAQWACAVGYLVLTLLAWREEDGAR